MESEVNLQGLIMGFGEVLDVMAMRLISSCTQQLCADVCGWKKEGGCG